MALEKVLEGRFGLDFTYHRINTIISHINQQVLVEISSYLNAEQRQVEKDAIADGQETGVAVPMDVMIKTQILSYPYNDDPITTPDIYRWLKEQPEFAGAEDIFEDESQESKADEIISLTQSMTKKIEKI